MALQRGNAVSFHNYGHRVNCRCNHNFSACDFALEGLIIVIIYYILGHTVSVPRICLRIGWSGALCWEGQACYFRSGVKLEWPKLEAERADSRGGCFRRGKLAPCLPARGSGERCKLPQRDPAAEGSRGARWPLLELVGVTFGGGLAQLFPLKFAYVLTACSSLLQQFCAVYDMIFLRLVCTSFCHWIKEWLFNRTNILNQFLSG